jgi:polyisoprenyl-phosphate glycosyltransferase
VLSILQKHSLSIIVPVPNEGNSLEALRSRLVDVLDDLDLQWDIIFVDDGSTDETLTQIKRMNHEDSRIKAVALSRNFGKEIAVAAGLRYATGDAAVIIDGDLQHPPELLQEFVRQWRAGYDVVYGKRIDRKVAATTRDGLVRNFYSLFRLLSGISLPKGAGDFRLLSRRAVDAMNQLGERARFNKGLFAWIGFRAIGVPYKPTERHGGKPKWKLGRLFGLALDGITAFSTIPLRVWSYLGLGISLLAVSYAVFFLISTLLFDRDVPGFPSLIISIMLLAGASFSWGHR